MSLPTVLVDAGPWLDVPPSGYGGVENVIATLVPELRRAGHRVVVATVGTSRVEADDLVTPWPRPRFDALPGPAPQAFGVVHAHLAGVLDYLADHPEIDLVHSHVEVVGPAMLAAVPTAPPTLHTLHWDPRRQAELYEVFDGRGRVWVNGVSASHVARMPANLRRQCLGAVLLSTPMPPPKPDPAPDAPLLVLGRICEVKGQDTAALVAKALDRDLVIAGPVADASDADALAAAGDRLGHNADVAFLRDRVSPLLDGHRRRWVGSVGGAEKVALLAGAHALLAPVRWEEPGATVVVEALAAGTPVVALRRGVMPELIDHGVTGFLADDADEMVELTSRVGELDRAICRRVAEERFSPARMAGDYQRLYNEVLRRSGQTVVEARASGPVPVAG